MVIAGFVKGIYSATQKDQKSPRPTTKILEFIENHGIKEDKFAGSDMEKTVMIVGQKAYDMAKEEGIDLEPGSLGENILLDFDPHDFMYGTIFTLGDVQLQITEDCSMCKHLTVFDNRLPKLLLHHRGRYCKILHGGTVKVGQIVTL